MPDSDGTVSPKSFSTIVDTNNNGPTQSMKSIAKAGRTARDAARSGQQFNYAYDKTARLTAVTGSTAFNGITNYASSPTYNARGNLIGLNYGNGTQMTVTGFNNRLQATSFEVKKDNISIIKKEYQFYADGSLKFVDDMLDAKFDRSYKYDFAGRTTEAKAGAAARGETDQGINIPYSRQYAHDAFGNITQMSGTFYTTPDTSVYNFNAADRNPNWTYDADGNTVSDEDATYEIDAAGRIVRTRQLDYDTGTLLPPTADFFDGAGGLVKRVNNFGSTAPAASASYFIRSSVLGKVLSETDATGKKRKTFVPANGTVLAEQVMPTVTFTSEQLTFLHRDAANVTLRSTNAAGNLSYESGEYDAMGRNVVDAGPYVTLNTELPSNENGGGIDLGGTGQGYRPGRGQFSIDGMAVPESYYMMHLNSGRIGGAFGLLELARRMSTRYQVKNARGEKLDYDGYSLTDAKAAARRNETFHVDAYHYDWSFSVLLGSWSANWADFKLGKKSNQQFTSDEEASLKEAFKIVNSKKCKDWINKTIWPFVRPFEEGETNIAPVASTADELLGVATFHRYSDSLTAKEMGISEDARKKISQKTFVGVTLGKNIWLDPNYAFKLGSAFLKGTDLPASIVHELLHVFGLPDPLVATLNKEIQEHCGTGEGVVGGS